VRVPEYLWSDILIASSVVAAGPVSAHGNWFHKKSSWPLRWDLFLRPLPLTINNHAVLRRRAAWHKLGA